MKPHGAAIDDFLRVKGGRPVHLAAKAKLGILSARTTPDFASRKLARTSWVLLPMDETMPIPVTTTRLIPASSDQ